MGSNLESSNSKAEKTDNGRFQQDERLALWFQELTPGDFHRVDKDHNIKQQGLLPTLELSSEPKKKTVLDDDGRNYEERSTQPGAPAHWKTGPAHHEADDRSRPGDPARWKDRPCTDDASKTGAPNK